MSCRDNLKPLWNQIINIVAIGEININHLINKSDSLIEQIYGYADLLMTSHETRLDDSFFVR